MSKADRRKIAMILLGALNGLAAPVTIGAICYAISIEHPIWSHPVWIVMLAFCVITNIIGCIVCFQGARKGKTT